VPLLSGRTVRSAFLENVGKNMLLVAAGAFSTLGRFIAASLFIEIHSIHVRFGIHLL
jgi:hypothetical protein